MPRRLFLPALLSVVLFASAAANAVAQVPRVVKFTGVLPGVSTTATVTFAIYAEPSGGLPLWEEAQAVTIDAQGRYTVPIGATRQDGLPNELFANGEARWLGVRAEGHDEGPRVALLSVPYALKAADAETIGGKPLSAFVMAGDRTGVGADGLTYVDARVLTQGLGGGAAAQQSAGTPDYLGMFAADGSTLVSSSIYQGSPNVGIGTNAPAAGLHLAAVTTAGPAMFVDAFANGVLGTLPMLYRAARGTPAAPTAVQTDDILGGLAVRAYGSTKFSGGRGQVMFKAAENWTDAANGTYLVFATEPIGASTIASERMRITPDGKVGIGTTAPTQALSVDGFIETTSGGLKFADGSTQMTAARTSGNVNAAFGYQSLAANTNGGYNVAFGTMALAANTSAWDNSAVGAFTLAANTTGRYNTAVGSGSLSKNTTANYNTATGYQSLTANTEGPHNAAFGALALMANTTGADNSAFGTLALSRVTVGVENTGVGGDALINATSDDNTAVGFSSLSQLADGGNNTAVGHSAGAGVTSGIANTFVGSGAHTTAAGLYGSTAIGAGAIVSQDNSLVLGGTGMWAVNVGIGTTSPNTLLQVVGDIRVGTSGTNGCLKNFAGTGLIGTCSSDLRLKRNVRPFAQVLDKVARLQPVSFEWRESEFPEYHFGAGVNSGLIAQDVERVFPEMVSTDEHGFEMVDYAELPYLTLAAVKELTAKAASLEAENNAVKSENAELRSLLAALAERVATLEKR